MADRRLDRVEFDEIVSLALARAADAGQLPGPEVKARLLAHLGLGAEAPPVLDLGAKVSALPPGYRFNLEAGADWQPHPVPGIRMRVLSLDRQREYATLLLDVAPGTHFPPHHHEGAEECYIVSGSAYTFGRRMGPGDFLHADAGTEHGELYTEEGCRVILVVRPEDYMS